jgi:lipoprotein NlpI
MQKMVSWRPWLFASVFGITALAAPAWSQQQAQAAAPVAGSDAKTYVEYGMSNGAKGDLAAAVKAFDQAISIDPKYAPAYYNRGFAYALEGKSNDAISNYDQAIQLDPNYMAAFYQRGSLKGEKGDFNAALQDFDAVIKLNPKYAPAYYNRGHVQYFQGDLNGAFDQVNIALSLDPNFPFSYFIRGLIRHAQGHGPDAMADFQKSAGLNFPYAVYWVWISEMEGGQPALARKDLSDYLNKPEEFKPGDWPSQIGNFLLGKISREDLLAKANGGNADVTRGRLCEAWFYAGMYDALAHGSTDKAKECFTQALGTGAKGSEELIEANRQLTKPPL